MLWRAFQLLMFFNVLAAGMALYGDYLKRKEDMCFKLTAGNEAQPHSAILLNECNGTSWMLVRVESPDTTKTFTYQWQLLMRLDETPRLYLQDDAR